MEGRKGNVLVLFDVENFYYAGLHDSQNTGFDATRIIPCSVRAIELIAHTYGSIRARISALALPRLNSNGTASAIVKARAAVTKTVERLSDYGFDVPVVLPRKNAADDWLCEIGLLWAEKQEVDTVILATRDAEEPFFSFIQKLLERGKKIHIVTYDSIPARIAKIGPDIPITCIAADIRISLQETSHETSTEPQIPRERNSVPNETKSLRQSIKEVVQTGACKNEVHALWIQNIVSLLLQCKSWKENKTMRYLSFGYLLSQAIKEKQTWPSPQPTDEETKLMLNGILHETDFFQSKIMFEFNPQNRFLTIIHALRSQKEAGLSERAHSI